MAAFRLPLFKKGEVMVRDPFPLAGKGQGMGVSAPWSPVRRLAAFTRSIQLTPPPLAPPRKGAGNAEAASVSHHAEGG
jgi:hypothetical protein